MKVIDIFEDKKPSSWNSIKDTISPGDIDETKIPHHYAKDLWNSSNPSPLDHFDKRPTADTFVLSVNNDTFLVSAGGGNYIRTAERLD